MTSLREASRAMRRERPVFIVGEARSGTSLLYRTLQKHPSFRPREIQLAETEIFAFRRRVALFRPGYPPPLVRYMLDDAAVYRAFLRSIAPVRAWNALTLPVNVVVSDPPPWWWRANLYHLLVRSYFFHAQRARGCRRLVEKTPTNTRYLAQLHDAFPRARFVYIHRHPVDVFSSYRRRGLMDPAATWAARLTIDGFCTAYRAAVARVQRWRRSHRNLALVGYADFTREPAREFAALCRFLEEEDVPEAVEEREPQPGRWRGDPHLWSGILATTKDWRDFITPREADAVQHRLADVMETLGYEPYDVG